MILINGASKNHIDITDRGFQYGDGLFETLEVKAGHPVFLKRHLERLNSGCQRLSIPFPGFEILSVETNQLCANQSQAILKIIITRGSGGRGYRQPDLIQPTRVLSLHPYPDYPESFWEQGIVSRFCTHRLGLNPGLAGIKHLNRLEQIMARAEWNDPDIQEGLMLDVNDHVIEGTMTNLFYIKDNCLYTSILSHSGVTGILRSLVMKLAEDCTIPVIEHLFDKDELLSANEVFVCNSIIGIWPVRQIENSRFCVGQITRDLQLQLRGLIKTELNNEH